MYHIVHLSEVCGKEMKKKNDPGYSYVEDSEVFHAYCLFSLEAGQVNFLSSSFIVNSVSDCLFMLLCDALVTYTGCFFAFFSLFPG